MLCDLYTPFSGILPICDKLHRVDQSGFYWYISGALEKSTLLCEPEGHLHSIYYSGKLKLDDICWLVW
jgi:hypothetical protein